MDNYFCGWYLKFQNGSQTVALIPAYHITNGEKTCSIQVITDDAAWNISFAFSQFHQDENGIQIGNSIFTRQGVLLDLHGEGLDAVGKLVFGPFSPIRYDIMGPFKYVPFLQCRHSVFSMMHSVSGKLTINDQEYAFQNGVCYIEGDRGHSFPKEYVWAQCFFPEGSIMLSVADIPFWGFHFTGVICVIHYCGKEYRLATYLGARAVYIHDREVVIRQGTKTLIVKQLERKGHPLAAPISGKMSRTIHETAACRAYFHYQEKGKTVFELESNQASFEYEYPQ